MAVTTRTCAGLVTSAYLLGVVSGFVLNKYARRALHIANVTQKGLRECIVSLLLRSSTGVLQSAYDKAKKTL
jgi:hypothetical protein